MRYFLLFTVLTVAFLGNAQVNLLESNPDFEENEYHKNGQRWFLTGQNVDLKNGLGPAEKKHVYNGKYSAKVTNHTANGKNASFKLAYFYTSKIDLIPNNEYVLSVYVKALPYDKNDTTPKTVKLKDNNKENRAFSPVLFELTDEYQKLEVAFTASADPGKLQFVINLGSDKGHFYFDDAFLENKTASK